MKKFIVATVLMIIVWFCCGTLGGAISPNLVRRWAPVVYPKLEKSDDDFPQGDIFTIVNYDHDWRSNNNWDNLLFYSQEMAMYFSVVESEDYNYFSYYQYFPRHLGDNPHEHDLTGILVVVRKNADGPGRMERILSYSNGKYNEWDGAKVQLIDGHPMITIAAGSHEIKALATCGKAMHRSGIFPNYYCNFQSRSVYRLIPLAQLWDRRQDIGLYHIFSRWGYFDSYQYQQATAPWVWNYHGYNWLAQPGEMVQRFVKMKIQPVNYLDNPYQVKSTIKS